MDFLKDLSWGTQNTYLLEQVHIDMCGVCALTMNIAVAHMPELKDPHLQNLHTMFTYHQS